jgi:hypothetical protein
MSRATMNRRAFLGTAAAAAGGLLVRFRMTAAETTAPSKLNAFIYVGADDSVLLYIHKAEMEQGTVTSLFHAAGRGSGVRLEEDPHRFSGHQPRIRRQSRRGGKREHTQLLGIPAPRGRHRARNVEGSGGPKVGRGSRLATRRKQLYREPRQRRAAELRQPGGGGLQSATAGGRDAQGSQPIPDCGQSYQAPGYSRQSGWQRGFRHRRAGARNAVRRGGALSGLRRQGGALRCRQSQGGARRQERGANSERRGRAGRQYLVRHGGPECAGNRVGRGGRGGGVHCQPHQTLRRADGAAGPGRAQGGRCRNRSGRRSQQGGSDLRSAVPGARPDGAAQRGGPRAAGWLRGVGLHAGPDVRAQRGAAHHRPRARGGQDLHQIHGRRLRTAGARRLHRRSGGGVQGRGRACEADMVA